MSVLTDPILVPTAPYWPFELPYRSPTGPIMVFLGPTDHILVPTGTIIAHAGPVLVIYKPCIGPYKPILTPTQDPIWFLNTALFFPSNPM